MRIRWTEPAARDLTQICDYIEEHEGRVTARRVALTIIMAWILSPRFRIVDVRGARKILASSYFTGCPFWPFTACVRMSLKSTASCMVHRTGLRSPRRINQHGVRWEFPHGGNRRYGEATQ